ncbi:hypothetical protein BC943DRAFT_260147, partial [Umbelopsis sp. AD052]
LQSNGVEQNITRLDELGVHNRYKFGVLVVKDGQTKEEDWFANSETPDGLERFLNIVSKRVELQGYEGWSAGLDTRSGDSGTHTYISMRDDSTLAFHVAPLIPSRPVDKQHIQRKRHIGNDIVCVIFVDGRQPFNPAAIKSQFLHVFIVVHEELVDNQPVWRVEVVANENVGKFGPALPPNGLFYTSDQLASFIHVKLINAENAALKSPKFAAPNARAREGILLNHIQRIIGLAEKPGAKKRLLKSPSTLSDPSQRAFDSVVGLDFSLPDKTAGGKVRPVPGMSPQSPSQHHQAAVMSAAAAAMFNDNDQYPTYEDFQCIVQEYLDNLSPKKRDKALVDQHRYTLILQVLKDPRNTAISTAQFRFWVKKMFQLAPTDTLDIVCHDNKPVAMREQIYEILVRAHREAHHGGRDKTSALVRRRYSWIPKELIARFVRNCPFCISRRNSSQSPSIGAPKTP